jgi:hypothetical protein
LNGTTGKGRIEPKLAAKIARRLSGLWDWLNTLKRFYSQNDLVSLVNGWLGIQAAPALAYVYVEKTIYPTHTGKPDLIRIRKMGNHEVN